MPPFRLHQKSWCAGVLLRAVRLPGGIVQGFELTRPLVFPILTRLSWAHWAWWWKGSLSAPEQWRTERGEEERPKWGASPAKPREPLRCKKMQFTPWGEASSRSTGFRVDICDSWARPGNSFGFWRPFRFIHPQTSALANQPTPKTTKQS